MPFRKYRSVEEMPGPVARRPLDPENLVLACELSEVAYRLQPWRFEPGVRKFRSIEEMSAAKAERERALVRRASRLPAKADRPG